MRNKINVLIISQYFPPDFGGAASRAEEMIKALSESSCSIRVLTAVPHLPNGNKHVRKAFLLNNDSNLNEVIRVWMPPFATEGILRRLLLWIWFAIFSLITSVVILRKRVDVILCVSPNYFSFFTGFFLKHLKFHKAKLVHDIVDIWPDAILYAGYTGVSPFKKIIEYFFLPTYRFSDYLITLTPSMKNILQSRSSLPSHKIFILQNPVYFPDKKLSKKYDLPFKPEDKKVVAYVGRLSTYYDFDVMLEAAKFFGDKDGRIMFYMIGEGEKGDYIEHKIRDMQLSNFVLIRRVIPKNYMLEYLEFADMLVIPLKQGFGSIGFPSKLPEYLASGRPVVVCADGYVGKIAKSIPNAFSFPPNAQLLCNFISMYFDNVSSYKADRALDKQLYDSFNFNHFSQKLIEIVEQVTKV